MKRRNFLRVGALAAVPLHGRTAAGATAESPPRKRLAAIVAAYRMHSDADNVVTRMLQGYYIGDDYHQPSCDIASLYIHRVPVDDIGHRISQAYRFPVAKTIPEALTLGTGTLAVDGVLLVCDAEETPSNDDLRFEFFQQMLDVFRRSGRSVPLFCSGYLSAAWDRANEMVRRSREMGFPLMAGSSMPVTFRRPALDYPLPSGFDDRPLGDVAPPKFPLGVDFAEALAIAPGSSLTTGLFPSLEVLQSILERRRAGETGIRSVEHLVDDAVWRAVEAGRWSRELMQAALARAGQSAKETPGNTARAALWLVEYNDGTHVAVLWLSGLRPDCAVAFRVKDRREIDSALCYVPLASRNDFSMLVHGISQMMISGKPPYPVERILLTSGVIAALGKQSVSGAKIETPALNISYEAPEHSFYAPGWGW
jgi:hypothetical protein